MAASPAGPHRIGAKTRVFGIIGHPLGHTLSPALHNAAFAASGLDAVYVALPVEPAALEKAIAGVRAFRLAGLNVTVPHKVAVCDLVDELTPEARAAGAVNTLFWRDDFLVGHNTDIEGYEAMLRVAGGGTKALILGAGGSARAVGYTLRRAGIRTTVAARDLARARTLAGWLQRVEPCDREWPGAIALRDAPALLPEIDLVVNCTPVGMAPAADAAPLDSEAISRLPDHAVVHDLVYRPLETRLLVMARARNLRTVDGGVMLVAQAAAAFAAWTGCEPPEALMRGVFAEVIREVS